MGNIIRADRWTKIAPPSQQPCAPGTLRHRRSKAHHHAAFGDHYSAPCMWYVRGIDNLGVEDEQAALKKGEIRQSLRLHTLMVARLRDKVCPAGRARVSMNGSVGVGRRGAG